MARRYLWNDNEDQSLPTVDLEMTADGSSDMLLCPCGYKFFDPHPYVLTACPKCQGDIVFPRADW